MGAARRQGVQPPGWSDAAPRLARLAELVREEISSTLRDEVQDPRLQGVQITTVELSADGSRARLWYTTDAGYADPRVADVERALAGASPFLRARLGEALALKRTPDLVFRRDQATHVFDQHRPSG